MKEDPTGNLQITRSKCNDILQCVLNLNPLEVASYKHLVKRGPMRADELAEIIGKDRSTAYRCLMDLVTCGICTKSTKTIEKGGCYHLYSAVPPARAKVKLRQCSEQWYRKMSDAIEDFPYD